MLTLNDVAALAGVTPQAIRNWISEGVIAPTVPGGKGPGNQARFDVMATLGLVVAVSVHRTARSCALVYFARLAAAFAAVSEGWLLEKFSKRLTHLLTVQGGHPVLSGARYDDQVDVRAAFEAVEARRGEGASVAQ